MIHLCNLPREVCHKLIGRDHTAKHRMIAGLAIMAVGVAISKAGDLLPFAGSHFIVDMLGYGIHGLGVIPFIEHALD